MQYENEVQFERCFDSAEIFSLPVIPAYDPLTLDFLTQLSKSLLKDKQARNFPDLITFAYFCRKSNLLNFKKCHLGGLVDRNRFGWGVCLHIAPANIPMNFAFSFIMGFLSGNKNIVRLPSKDFEQINIFLDNFNALVAQEHFESLKGANLFIRTGRNSEKLINLVSLVEALVVWGGDSTVNQFRNFNKKSSCIEVYFPDRVSSLLLNCDQLVEKSPREMETICASFFNDTYLVDQNACSSPSMIYWYTQNNNTEQAKALFNQHMLSFLEREYELETISRIEKMIDVMRFCQAIDDSVQIDKVGDKLWYVNSQAHKFIKPKLGVFINKEINKIEELSALFRTNEQTLTYLGFDAETILAHFKNKVPCVIDRIVPLGKALDIGLIWDGKNMISTLSKYVDFQ